MKTHVKTPKGSDRSGADPDGNKWSVKLKADYGHINGTRGADKDHIDAFFGPDAANGDLPVHVIDQQNEDGSFDEHKVMLGYRTAEEATKAYHANYEPGYRGFADVTPMKLGDFKAWAFAPGPRSAPAAEDTTLKMAGGGLVKKLSAMFAKSDAPVDLSRRAAFGVAPRAEAKLPSADVGPISDAKLDALINTPVKRRTVLKQVASAGARMLPLQTSEAPAGAFKQLAEQIAGLGQGSEHTAAQNFPLFLKALQEGLGAGSPAKMWSSIGKETWLDPNVHASAESLARSPYLYKPSEKFQAAYTNALNQLGVDASTAQQLVTPDGLRASAKLTNLSKKAVAAGGAADARGPLLRYVSGDPIEDATFRAKLSEVVSSPEGYAASVTKPLGTGSLDFNRALQAHINPKLPQQLTSRYAETKEYMDLLNKDPEGLTALMQRYAPKLSAPPSIREPDYNSLINIGYAEGGLVQAIKDKIWGTKEERQKKLTEKFNTQQLQPVERLSTYANGTATAERMKAVDKYAAGGLVQAYGARKWPR